MTKTGCRTTDNTRSRRRLLSLLIAQALSLPAATQAATIVVDSATDDGNGCTLREAIVSVNSATPQPGCSNTGAAFGTDDEIGFSAAVEGQTITLNGSQIDIVRPLAINPSGTVQTTIDANNASRIFEINVNASTDPVELHRLTLVNGYSNIVRGGAIYAGSNSDLTITDCVFSGNEHAGDGGALSHFNADLEIVNSRFSDNVAQIANGGALWLRDSNVTISGSVFENNSAGGNSGAISFSGFSGSQNTLLIQDSIIAGNNAYQQGGGLVVTGGLTTIERSRIENNISQIGRGGGIYAYGSLQLDQVSLTGNQAMTSNNRKGGGLSLRNGNLTVTNSLVSGNSSGAGTGIAVDTPFGAVEITNTTVSGNHGGSAIFFQGSTIALNNVTITGNELPSGGLSSAALVVASSPVPAVTISNTIIANTINQADCFSGNAFAIGADTIIEDNQCGGSPTVADPLLMPLADNGGPTLTHALGAGSPAIDGGNNATCAMTDQRGLPRPVDGDGDSNAVCDIGALESGADNQPPVANDDIAVTNEDQSISIDVAVNDTDTDDNLDPTTTNTACATCSLPTNGLLTNNGGGTFDFTPAADFFGADSFVYEICDTDAACDTATVDITVDPVNDPPTFAAGADPAFPAGTSGVQSIANWPQNIDLGPNEMQQVDSYAVTTLSDPAGLLSGAAAISASGELSFSLSGASGTAQMNATLTDDGGTANGGSDTSQPVAFSITVAEPAADLEASSLQCAPRAAPDEPYAYSIVITNNGPDDATGVAASHMPIPGAAVNSISSPACVDTGSTVDCDLATISAGTSVQIGIEIQAPNAGAQVLQMTTNVVATTGDPNVGNNEDQATIEIVPGLVSVDGFESCTP